MDECAQLLDLIPSRRRDYDQLMGREAEQGGEEKRLELRLGLPGGEEEQWPSSEERRGDPSLLSLGYNFSKLSKGNNSNHFSGAKRVVFLDTVESKTEGFLQLKTCSGLEKELAQKANGKSCCPPSPPHASTASASKNAAGSNSSPQTRTASVPIVGWPPIRSFRKNLASTSKASVEPQIVKSEETMKLENNRKGLFVKINMDGIPIGRKVDLNAYDSYEKLSLAVDELFRGLLAAQKDPLATGTQKSVGEFQQITGLLDGSGEYTLVYEDDEGDRMLVGDVPWNMFVRTAKRLRVLKTSELSTISLGAVSKKRAATDYKVI